MNARLPRVHVTMRPESSTLIAVDPGNMAGVAVFKDARLVNVELVVEAVQRCWVWKGPFGLPVVVEVPEKYEGSRIDTARLMTLTFTAGYIASSMRPEQVFKVLPKDWKGQRPKHVDNKHTMRLLSDQECHILEAARIPAGQRHNVVDAIGIGLWALSRR